MRKEFLEELEEDIRQAATGQVDADKAKDLAAKFLLAQLEISRSLRKADLDARLNKQGTKQKKAKVYMEEVAKAEKGGGKKPSDVLLEQLVNTDPGVNFEQTRLDESEVKRDELQDYQNVFKDAHIYFRKCAGDKFDG